MFLSGLLSSVQDAVYEVKCEMMSVHCIVAMLRMLDFPMN